MTAIAQKFREVDGPTWLVALVLYSAWFLLVWYNAVLPWYANTHTESSGTGRQTSQLREEARQMIGNAVGGTEDDLVIFCG